MATMAKQIITDEESKLKRQARRRLLGAVALTILVVVLLPMVLDREPPAPTQDIELQIPDKNTVGEFVPKMVLPSLNASDAASQPVSAPVIAPLLDVKPVAVHDKADNSKPESQAKSESQAKPGSEAKPKAEAGQRNQTARVNTKKPHTGFVLQVGAFANASAAKALHEKLQEQGYPSYIEKIGDKTRVRVGGYSTHADAEKVRHKLEIQGMKPDVVNLN